MAADPELWKAIAAVASAVAGLGGWRVGKSIERKRSNRRVEREVLLDEGENGTATLRKMVREGFDDLSGRLDRTSRTLQEEVRNLWSAYDRAARELREHEQEEAQAFRAVADNIAELSTRIEGALPAPPPGMPERRSGRR